MTRHSIIPGIIAIWLLVAGLTLVTIVLKSPYTHSNLVSGPDQGYTRTPQSLVNVAPEPFHGPGLAEVAATSDQVQHGSELLIANQCATCHGIDGRGGSVNKPIVGFTVAELRDKTTKGPGEMPSFGNTLSDQDLAAIAAYLDSMKTTQANS
jgi:mono/diheme cytochrome c family protein